ncbi:hypothetical protein [Frankia gtarii]|uniref:hypothetical protein n=1 Tax=Frankia gtarii TaxID=2950102 RepID=UPI0021BF353D|nr:hypothetical protein [Frankia gtarii]
MDGDILRISNFPSISGLRSGGAGSPIGANAAANTPTRRTCRTRKPPISYIHSKPGGAERTLFQTQRRNKFHGGLNHFFWKAVGNNITTTKGEAVALVRKVLSLGVMVFAVFAIILANTAAQAQPPGAPEGGGQQGGGWNSGRQSGGWNGGWR